MLTTITTSTTIRTTTTTVVTGDEADWTPELTDLADELDLQYARPPQAGRGADHTLLPAPPHLQARCRRDCRWDYYAVVGALLAAALGLLCEQQQLAVCGAAIWLMLTALFCLQRLRASPAPRAHWRELVLGSALIPPLAVCRRLTGVVRRRPPFA